MWLSTSYYDSGVYSVGTSQSAQEGQSRQRSERGHQGCGGRSGHQRWRCLPSSANHTCADSALVAVMGKVRWPQVRRLQRWFFPISCSAPADAASGSRAPSFMRRSLFRPLRSLARANCAVGDNYRCLRNRSVSSFALIDFAITTNQFWGDQTFVERRTPRGLFFRT